MSEQTKNKILEVAIALFKEQGFKKTTLTKVSEQSGYSRVTLYKYYSCKEDLLRDMMLYQAEKRFKAYQILLQQNPDQGVWHNIKQLASLFFVDSPFEVPNDEIYEELLDAVLKLAKEQLQAIKQRVYAELTTQVDKGIAEQAFSLQKSGLLPSDFAEQLLYTFEGIYSSQVPSQREKKIHRTVSLFQAVL